MRAERARGRAGCGGCLSSAGANRPPGVARVRSIVVAGAGVGGLTATLALARQGFRVTVLEAAPQLGEAGAGIQLAPNATRVLQALGLGEALRPYVVAPEAIRILHWRSGRELARIPLGKAAQTRYGAPYWLIHRGDLQRVLLDAVAAQPEIVLRLGASVAGHAARAGEVIVAALAGQTRLQEYASALVGADGLWSTVRASLGHAARPRFRARKAWRAVLSAETLAPEWRAPMTNLWLGPDAHMVHYPIQGAAAVNLVAIVSDRSEMRGWSAPGNSDDLLPRFARWAPGAQAILRASPMWQTWSLFDLPPLPHWGAGAVTLLGDAAHGALPFLAQGGGMAIEDAWVLANELARASGDPAVAFRRYEAARRPRTARLARAAACTGRIYHLKGPFAAARNVMLRLVGGERLRGRQDWIYDWTGE
jgi:salicylate hydroxylase